MYSDAKRIHLLESILKEQDDAVLNAVEKLLVVAGDTSNATTTFDFASITGLLTQEEGDELDRIIEEGCEQIHPMDLINPFDDAPANP